MNLNLIDLAYVFIAFLISITLHEFAHALMGDRLGDRTARNEGRVSLNPMVHIDPLMTVILPLSLFFLHSPVIFGAARPVPFNPWAVKYGKWGVALVAAAGPAMNLLLACIFASGIAIGYQSFSPNIIHFLITNISVNLGLMVFNLIPIPPLDGSRILYAAAPMPVRDFMDTLERNGLAVIFVLLLIGGPILYPILGGITGAIMRVLVPGVTGLST